jgi:hypothetical protein
VVDKLAVATSRLAAIRAGEGHGIAHLSDEAWLAWLEGLGVDISGLQALYLAPVEDDEGTKLLGTSCSTSSGGSHRGGKHGKKGKKTKGQS